MRDRWVRLCRRLVPRSLRAAAFDPSVSDLRQDFFGAPIRPGGARRFLRLRFMLAVLASAVECRRLAAGARLQQVSTRVLTEPPFVAWWRDVRLGARALGRQPVFTGVAVLTLAVGIGANVAAFTLVSAYLIAPLPVPAAGDLVRVYGHTAERPFDTLSYPNYRDARDTATGVDLAVHVGTEVQVGSGDGADMRTLELVSANYFRVLRLAPVAGRLLGADDGGAEGAHPVVVLGETYWRARYGADPAVVGGSVLLNGQSFQVVGIAPAGFHGAIGAGGADLWAPVEMQQVLRPRGRTLELRGWGWLHTIGRRAPGVTLAQSRLAFDRAADQINRQTSSTLNGLAFVVAPATLLEESERTALLPYIKLAFVFTGLLLVVTCANLGGILQTRVVSRRRETAIRQSLGAGRGRLLSEWLTECGLLAVGGGVAGLVFARLTLVALNHFRAPAALIGDLEIVAPITGAVLGFTAGVSFVAAALFGLVPALRAAAAQPLSLLKEEMTTATVGRSRARLRRATVLVQVAVSGVFLVGAALLVVSLSHVQALDPGFRTENLALVEVDLKRDRIAPDEMTAFRVGLLGRVRGLPGVVSADVVANPALQSGHDRMGFRIPGYVPRAGSTTVTMDENIVGAAYFKTLGLSFVRGGPWDPAATQPGAVVNQTAADRFWPGRNAVGQPLEVVSGPVLVVTGVVHDSAYYEIGEAPMPFVFLPAEAVGPSAYTLMARTSAPAGDLLKTIAHAVTETDPRVRPLDARTLDELRQARLYPRRLLTSMASIFGALALLLAGIGLYGVVSTSVAQRTREIGVRMALGARGADVLAGVLREALVLAGAGVMVGLAGGWLLGGALKSWLVGIAAFDAGLYAVVAVSLAVIAIAAAWVPARRASRVDPVVALRS